MRRAISSRHWSGPFPFHPRQRLWFPGRRRGEPSPSHAAALPRRDATRPSYANRSAPKTEGVRDPKEGAGNAGCPSHPQPRAQRVESTRVRHHRSTASPGIPARNGFNGFLRALPGDRALLSPSPARSLLLANLTPASGRQDHTTSPSASRAVRQKRIRVHRIPRPTSVTIAIRPSKRAGDSAK